MLLSPIAYDKRRKEIFYPKTDILFQPALCADLPHTRDHDATLFQPIVAEIVERRLKCSSARVMPICSSGTYHLVFKAETAHGERYIVRVNRLPQVLHALEFLIDAWVYPLLHQHGLSVPTVFDVDCSRSWCTTDYQIMSYVDGHTLDAFQNSETQYMAPDLLTSLGAYVAQVHQVKLAGFGPIAVAPLPAQVSGIHTSWQDYVLLRLDEHVAWCTKHEAVSDAQAVEIQNMFKKYRDMFLCTNPVLLHGDLGNHNFISADGKTIAALIDWEDCMSGDPVFDIAFWGTFYKDDMLSLFLGGYVKHATLPDNFQLRYWLYYLRIALSKTVHRIRFGYKDRPGRPPASLRIQKALRKLQDI